MYAFKWRNDTRETPLQQKSIIVRLFLTLALLTLSGVGSAQVYFNRQIDWEHEYEYLGGVVVFGDSNRLLVAGGNNDLTATYIDHYLISKLSGKGELLWKKSFLPRPNSSGNTVSLLKLDEEYSLIYGNADLLDAAPENYQYFLIKIRNETGDTVWVKELGSYSSQDGGYKCIRTLDGGFAICGFSFLTNNSQQNRIVLLKTDSLGNQQFRKEYTTDTSKDHYGYSLVQTSDGGYLLFGIRDYTGTYPGGLFTSHKNDMVLLKTDALGNQEWVKVYPSWEWKQTFFYGRDLQVLSDSNYLIAGLKGYAVFQPGVSYAGNYFFARLNQSGEFIDSVTIPGMHELPRINRLKPSSDGNFWAIGAEKDSQSLGQTGLIMKITPNLEVLWKREYRVSPPESMLHEIFYEGVEMPDHGFVLCGGAFGPLEDSTNANGWVIRVDSLGCLEPGCNGSSAAPEPPGEAPDIGITLSPNPTSGILRLALTRAGDVLLGARVLDMQGRVLSDVQFLRSAGWRECVLDLSGQPAGAYVVQVRSNAGWHVRKIIKQ